MFITTQHGHTISSSGYTQPQIRTGEETLIAQRTGKMFAGSASDDGRVVSVSDAGIVVEYVSGKKEGFPLGRQYGRAEGSVYPHDLVTRYRVGDKFEATDVITYNTKFFEPDALDPSIVVMKTNMPVRTAFIETNQTHEDSCAISAKLAQKLHVESIKVKSFVVKFKESLESVVKPGDIVEPQTPLMVILDEIAAASQQYSEASLETLKRQSNNAPLAKVSGRVERIEVFYHGDKSDMSRSLRRLADLSDAAVARAAKDTNQPSMTDRVTAEYRVSGTPLELDHAEVRIYLSVESGTGTGDKVVIGHQMKCTVAEVMPSLVHTEDGEEVDLFFSHRSVAARGALSPMLLCAYGTLLDAVEKRAVKTYFGV